MAAIEYTVGDATAPAADGRRIVAHICNDIGGWGAGFVLAISKRWPEVEASYRGWFRERNPAFALGEVQLVEAEPGLAVANMIAQQGIRAAGGVPPIRYEALETCLARLATLASGASVHMPRIGCGLAGGTWDRVEPIIERTLIAAGVPVTVYDWRPD